MFAAIILYLVDKKRKKQQVNLEWFNVDNSMTYHKYDDYEKSLPPTKLILLDERNRTKSTCPPNNDVPPFLTITLNEFNGTRRRENYHKIEIQVQVPKTIELRQTFQSNYLSHTNLTISRDQSVHVTCSNPN